MGRQKGAISRRSRRGVVKEKGEWKARREKKEKRGERGEVQYNCPSVRGANAFLVFSFPFFLSFFVAWPLYQSLIFFFFLFYSVETDRYRASRPVR